MFPKTKAVSDEPGESSELDMIETKRVKCRRQSGSRKNAGVKNEGHSHYVVDNK
jgi:hypothetical protein